MNSEKELKQRINKLEDTIDNILLPRLLCLEKLNINEKIEMDERSEKEKKVEKKKDLKNSPSGINILLTIIDFFIIGAPSVVAIILIILILINLVVKLFESTGLLPF